MEFFSPEEKHNFANERRQLIKDTQVMMDQGEILLNMCKSLSAGMSILFSS